MKISRRSSNLRSNKILIPTGIALLLVSGVFGVLKFHDIFSPKQGNMANQSDQQQEESSKTEDQTQTPPEIKPNEEVAEKPPASSQNPSLSEAGNILWIVNKIRPLDPLRYQPSDLVFPDVALRVPGNESMRIRTETATAIEKLFTGAQSAGHSPMFSSGFRSYNYQVNLYGGYVKSQGQAEADKQSARPGYSEHQTGLAFDICNAGSCKLEQSFGTTPLGQWVANNAHNYGFVIRYKENKQDVTGYMYEPWHLRYIGTDTATKVYQSGKTLEEYFGLPAAPDYNQ